MKKLLMLSATGLMMLSVPAFAGHHEGGDMQKGEKAKEMFQEADSNNDGMISKEEYMNHVHAKAAVKFAEKDTNSDGNITMEESKSYMQKKHEEMKEKRSEMRDNMQERMKEKRMEKMEDSKPESSSSDSM